MTALLWMEMESVCKRVRGDKALRSPDFSTLQPLTPTLKSVRGTFRLSVVDEFGTATIVLAENSAPGVIGSQEQAIKVNSFTRGAENTMIITFEVDHAALPGAEWIGEGSGVSNGSASGIMNLDYEVQDKRTDSR